MVDRYMQGKGNQPAGSLLQKQTTVGEFFVLLLSCMLCSFLQGGFWLFVPGLSGAIAFGISCAIIVVCLLDTLALTCFVRVQKGYGIAALIFVTFLMLILKEQNFTASPFLTAIHCLAVTLIGAYFYNRQHVRKYLLWFLLIEALLKLVVDAQAVLQNDMAIRESALNSINTEGVERLVSLAALYTFSVIYFIVLCNYKQIRRKVIALCYMLFTLWILYAAQLTMIFLITLFVTAFAFFSDFRHFKRTIFIAIVAFAIVFIALPWLLDVLITNEVFSSETTGRLADIQSIFFGNRSFSSALEYYGAHQGVTSTEGRLFFYIRSFKAAWNNLALGFLQPDYIITGGHSLWLDYIAEYGVLILVFFYGIFRYLKHLYLSGNANVKKLVVCFGILYTVAGIFNAFNISLFMIHLYLLLPFLSDILCPDITERIAQ